ncbi:acyl-CoA reductase [Sphingobacterium psychroaquaticum]|uniref:Acyl-CoA reductase (LuxC) n=1 Tax=Sphingobacterium psychroaquaticum TaxID=561061 RepID=A0A1X7I927_9SPHI|nr:acyl-CoA reductase [Sphingobacterium psychroaquaticum]SMG10500.1 Acyl-CoA reductase (LuxC) [Sphingobacterium psychroaquaticum]
MTLNQRIKAFAALGDFLRSKPQVLRDVIAQAAVKNPWYTPANTIKQMEAIASNLEYDKLEAWVAPFGDIDTTKKVGLILAGNIPLVGFHDILAVLIAGFTAQIKVSSDDAGLTSFLLNALVEIEPQFATQIEVVERLKDFDLIIATGSDNSSRYFEYYFGQKPNIIRKNRNSIAILTGRESREQLEALGHDIFDYFGLGCRSVSKLYIPKDYPIDHFFEGIEIHKGIIDHFKYGNNYDYNKSIYLINGDKHFDNGFLLLKEDTKFASPLAVVFYETYESLEDLTAKLELEKDKIQCIVTPSAISLDIPTFELGGSQTPSLTDYADGVNTLAFLKANA